MAHSKWQKVDKENGDMSLRYMHDFINNMHCAPQLLQLQVFPDAKEITEV